MALLQKLDPEQIGKASTEWRTAQIGREIPAMLDPQSPEGGTMRLLRNPGHRVVQQGKGRRGRVKGIEPANISDSGELVEHGQVHFGGDSKKIDAGVGHTGIPLLVRNEIESDGAFAQRALMAAPRNTFWHSVDTQAARPWTNGVQLEDDSPELPSDLDLEGELMQNIDCRGNSMPEFMAETERLSTGLGLRYVLVDYSEEAGREYLRAIDAHHINRVWEDKLGAAYVQMRLARKEVNGRTYERVMIFARAGSELPQVGKALPVAAQAIYRREASRDKAGKNWAIEPQLQGGRVVRAVQMPPFVDIPLFPIGKGTMREGHLVLPPMLDAAKLDYTLLQITSQTEMATIIATTFVRFAKGLKEKDLEAMRALSSDAFYGTESEEADMKWLYLPADAIKAGMDVSTALVRAVEVAGLAPMMTRAAVQETATSQEIQEGRTRVVAERYAHQSVRQWSRVLSALAALVTMNRGVNYRLKAVTNFKVRNIDEARLLSSLYLQKDSIDPLTFWSEMHSFGVVSEPIDSDRLRAVQSEAERIERLKLETAQLQALVQLPSRGLLIATKEGRFEYLRGLRSHGVQLPADDNDLRKLAEDDSMLVPSGLQTLRQADAGGGTLY